LRLRGAADQRGVLVSKVVGGAGGWGVFLSPVTRLQMKGLAVVVASELTKGFRAVLRPSRCSFMKR